MIKLFFYLLLFVFGFSGGYLFGRLVYWSLVNKHRRKK